MPGGRPTKYRPEMCQTVIDAGKIGASLSEMASECGICHDTLIEWQKEKPEFSEAVKRAREESKIWWEKKGRSATFGGEEGFNATAFIFQMKNRFPDDYREKQEVQHSVEENTLKDLIRGQRNG
jgi:hypothetical protein